MSKESAVLEQIVPYPDELDQGFEVWQERDQSHDEEMAPIQYLALKEVKTEEEFRTALGNWHRFTEAQLDGLIAKQKAFREQMDADVNYLKNKLVFIEGRIVDSLRPGLDSKHITESVRMTYLRSEKVFVYDESRVPFDLCKTTVTPDIAKIREELKAGKQVDGAQLEERWNLQVKPGSLRAISQEKKRLKEVEDGKQEQY